MVPVSRHIASLSLLGVSFSLILHFTFFPPPTFADDSPAALVPIEAVATGFQALRGLAWGLDQALYASDWDAGVIYRIVPGGTSQLSVRQAGLQKPAGLAWGPHGAVYVVEEGADQIVRLNGMPTPVWTGLAHPTWLAVAADGTLYVTAQKSAERASRPQASETEDGFRLLRLRPGATTPDLLLSGLHEPGGLWVEPGGTLLVSLEKRSGESETASPTLLRLDPTLPPPLPPLSRSSWGPG